MTRSAWLLLRSAATLAVVLYVVALHVGIVPTGQMAFHAWALAVFVLSAALAFSGLGVLAIAIARRRTEADVLLAALQLAVGLYAGLLSFSAYFWR